MSLRYTYRYIVSTGAKKNAGGIWPSGVSPGKWERYSQKHCQRFLRPLGLAFRPEAFDPDEEEPDRDGAADAPPEELLCGRADDPEELLRSPWV